MLMSQKDVRGYQILATDGSIGTVSDFLFDDRNWTIRYLVIELGWLLGRKVLIAPEAFKDIDRVAGMISTSLTKKDVENSPGVGTDLPVSQQEEIALRRHYGWPDYWEAYPAMAGVAPLIPILERPQSEPEAAEEDGNPHLRSIHEVAGYHIHAKDGEIGHVEDFLIDDDGWCVRYLIVDTRNWLPGKRVLLAPAWATGIDLTERSVHVKLDRKAVENSPSYKPAHHVDRSYEAALHDHYGYPHYWI